MNTHLFALRRHPLAAPLLNGVILLLAIGIARFNGLYGQDAHAYVAMSRELYAWFFGAPAPTGISMQEFSPLYPLTGALLQVAGLDAVTALQAISLCSYVAILFFTAALIRLLSWGAHADSRQVHVSLVVGTAPILVRAGVTVMSDAMALALLLAAIYVGFKATESTKGRYAPLAALLLALAVSTRYAMVPLAGAFALHVGWHLILRRQFGMLAAFVAAGIAGMIPYMVTQAASNGYTGLDILHTLTDPAHRISGWSVGNIFSRHFEGLDGRLDYWLPNCLYMLIWPFFHPGFFPLLPLLFLLFRRTDLAVRNRKVLLVCVGLDMLFMSGLPMKSLRFLLPDFVLIALLAFPTWDRFYAYGFYFLKKKWMAPILAFALLVQVAGNGWMLRQVWRRNVLERAVAAAVQPVVPAGADLYAFDLDVSLKTYLPNLKHHNLWVARYDTFPEGAWVLFNEPRLRAQWTGHNPMFNWETLTAQYTLTPEAALPEGWTLYHIGPKE